MKRLLLLLLLFALAFGGAAYHECQRLKTENRRLEANVHSLNVGCAEYMTQAGQQAALCERLQLDCDELGQYCAELERQVQELGVKNKRLQAAAQAGSTTEVQVVTQVRDSIVYVAQEQRTDTMQVLQWQDAWVQLDGVIHDRQFEGSIISQDTLTVAVYRVPKRFLFFKWGCKRVECAATSANPHTRINSLKYVEIKK